MTQREKFKLAIYAILLIIAITLVVLLFLFNAARARDYQRLGDMRILASELNGYFAKFNTYRVQDCATPSLVNYCTGRGDRQLLVENLVDPLNDNGYQYLVNYLTDDDFEVIFSLEMGVAGLPAGSYKLTSRGFSS